MGQGHHTLRSISDPVYPHCLNVLDIVEENSTLSLAKAVTLNSPYVTNPELFVSNSWKANT